MKNKMLGLIMLGVIIGGAVAYQQVFRAGKVVVLKGFVGGEKTGFLEDEQVQKLLQKKYGISIEATKAGSIEMINELQGKNFDFLWPSSQLPLELFKLNPQNKLVKSDVIFNSPIVLYSWDLVTEALIKIKIVEKVQDTYYIVDFPKLIQLVVEGKKWADIGVNELYGKILITSTDPTKSNSGNMFAGLLANILSQTGDVANEQSLAPVLPKIKAIFTSLGFMETSSSNLFQAYLTKGIGDKPIIVGYENQIVEFTLQYEKLWPNVKDKVRILYPRPTVWSSHPLMILQDRAKTLIPALQDSDVQKLAWERHGFRTGLMGVQNDPKVLKIAGIPATITNVMPMPSPAVMEKIIAAVSK